MIARVDRRRLFAQVSPALIPTDEISFESTGQPDMINPDGELVHAITINGQSFRPDVTVEESHLDQLAVTDHPVEKGAGNAYVQDNAYKLPAEITITYGWSPSSQSSDNVVAGSKGRSATFLNDMYAQLLEIQASRLLFTVKTARRTYENMVLQGITLTTDVYTQNVLMVKMTCRQIIFAEMKTVTVALNRAVQMFPEKTQEVQPKATETLQPAPTVNKTEILKQVIPSFILKGFPL